MVVVKKRSGRSCREQRGEALRLRSLRSLNGWRRDAKGERKNGSGRSTKREVMYERERGDSLVKKENKKIKR